MTVSVANTQREAPVDATRMARLARSSVKRLHITASGRLAITFIDSRRLRTLNRRFLRHDRATDVLSFRYDGESACLPKPLRRRQVVGEILIAPRQARTYAKRHGLPYDEELSRYVVHGLLHWLGHDDGTPAQQRRMRMFEDQLLMQCGWLGARGCRPQPRTHSRTWI